MKQTTTYKWDVYKMENPEGQVYIGRTRNLVARTRHHKSATDKCSKLLHESLNKYGFAAHNMTVIDSFGGTQSYADDKEMFWIRSFMSNSSKWPEMRGLNLTDGGPGQIGAIPSQKQREAGKRMSKNITGWNRGIKMSEEARLNMSKAQKSAHNPHRFQKGRIVSEETAKKISIANTGRASKQRKAILVFDKTTGVFIKEIVGITQVSKELGIYLSMVTKVLRGEKKSTHGYIFKYKDK